MLANALPRQRNRRMRSASEPFRKAGVAVEDEAFAEAVFHSHRPEFGPRREVGGRRLDGNTESVLDGFEELLDLCPGDSARG